MSRITAFLAVMVTIAALAPPGASALTNANVIVIGSSECDGYVRKGFVASRLESAGFSPSIMCISASSPAFGIDVAAMDPPVASTVVLTLGLNVRPLPIFTEPAQSDLYVPETDAEGFITADGFRQSVRQTVTDLRDQGLERIIWFTIADNDHRWHDRYAVNNDILREESARLDFEVVDWDQMTDPSLFGSDGVHYTDEGYGFFAETLTEKITGAPAPTATQVGPCNYLTTGVTAAIGASVLGVSETEFLAGNPHWNPYWRFGGIVCEPVTEVPHPLSSGTPAAGAADRLLSYSPRTGALDHYFVGTPTGGNGLEIIGPAGTDGTGFFGGDTLTAISGGGMLLYDTDSGRFAVLQEGSDGSWSVTREMRGTTGWTHVIPGDYSGDGEPDLLFYRANDGLMRFYTIADDGGFRPLTPAMYGTRNWTHIVSGDFDGDGSDDVYWYRSNDGLMRFYRVASNGSFVPISPALYGTRNWTHITAGHFQGGSVSELVFYRADGVARFYGVDDQRGFAAISTPLSLPERYRQVVAADLDGDGYDDVFWYRSAGSVATTLAGGAHLPVTGTTPMQQEVVFVGSQ